MNNRTTLVFLLSITVIATWLLPLATVQGIVVWFMCIAYTALISGFAVAEGLTDQRDSK